MNYFITGSTGFIGIHLLNLLQKKSEVKKIYILVRDRKKLLKRVNKVEKFTIIEGNLENLEEIPVDVNYIIHLAGITKATKKEDYFRINAQATEKLANLSLKLRGLKKFLFVSSLAAAGPSFDCLRIKEDINPKPVSTYGKSKLEGEKRLLNLKEKLPIIILRPPAVYGQWDTDFLEAIKLVKKGLSLNILFKPEERILSLIHAEDIAEAIFHLIKLEANSGEIFFISEKKDLSWKIIEDKIAENLKRKIKIRITLPLWTGKALAHITNLLSKITGKPYIFNKDKISEIKYRCWLCSNEKLINSGFTPKHSFEDKISDVIEWYVRKGWL